MDWVEYAAILGIAARKAPAVLGELVRLYEIITEEHRPPPLVDAHVKRVLSDTPARPEPAEHHEGP